MTKSTGVENLCGLELFCEKYPHLSLLLVSEQANFEKPEIFCLPRPIQSEKELIYLLGISQASAHLTQWLSQDSKRWAIVIESSLNAIATWLSSQECINLLQNPQFDIAFIPEKKELKSDIEKLVMKHPASCFDIVIDNSYDEAKKAFANRVVDSLYASSFQIVNSLKEVINSDVLLENYLKNIKRAKEGFSLEALKGKFTHIPAILCGAGPSLDQHIEALKNAQGKALIIAAGSSIAALTKAGIDPHFLMAIDPNPLEYERLKSAKRTQAPLIHFLRLRYDVSDLFEGKKSLIPTKGLEWMNTFEGCIEEDTLEIVDSMDVESSSVITLAASFVVYLGCQNIALCGVDLSFNEDKTYSSGVDVGLSSSQGTYIEDEIVDALNVHKKIIKTPLKWLSEARALSRFIEKTERAQFFNVSAGIDIPFAKNVSFEDFMHTCTPEGNEISNFIREQTQAFKLRINEEKASGFIRELLDSACRCAKLLESFLSKLKSGISSAQKEVEEILLSEELSQELFYKQILGPIKFSIHLLHKEVENNSVLITSHLLEKLYKIQSILLSY